MAIEAIDRRQLATDGEDGVEACIGSFGNIRIKLEFKDDIATGGTYEILGEDQAAAEFAQAAIDLAVGLDFDDVVDVSETAILEAVGKDDEGSMRYARYAKGALGFTTTHHYRKGYDSFLGNLEDGAYDTGADPRSIMFRGFNMCAGCASFGSGCAPDTCGEN